ncbi:unnamed protein product [Arabidopsis lyrata]|uniref:Uncharacterized protein n=2 Tax=Arabidopsis lyrata subsp. lyrata TaxID=81972 RepID=D7KNB9_ARALL|nr:hypothetical protein ARALYDRAFT_888560 [Arabidopsis lyrata subsp. lyrata]CAH8280129.1 unnamed protein product [Arabidopsis lyrata]
MNTLNMDGKKKKSKVKRSSFVEEEDDNKYHHWLDRKEKREIGGYGKGKGCGGGVRADSSTRIGVGATAAGTTKFPWSNMRFVGL